MKKIKRRTGRSLLPHPLPVISGRVQCFFTYSDKWKCTAKTRSDGEIVFITEYADGWLEELQRTKRVFRNISSHQLRSDFMDIKTPQDAISFFTRYGRYSERMKSGNFSMKQITDEQSRLRKARAMSRKEFFDRLNPDGSSHGERTPWYCTIHPGIPPIIQYLADYEMGDAMWQATYVDQLAALRASICPQCGTQFTQRTDAKPKIYCDKTCSGSARKARWNANRKAAKRTRQV